MRIDILTLFPEMFEAVLKESIIGRAVDKKLLDLEFHNIRDYSDNKHKKVDDYPYGGGLGMIMQCQPIFAAVEAIREKLGEKPHIILMSPQGRTFDQSKAEELSCYKNITIICGHYEGIDERVTEALVDEEISIGDFVLTGGEIAAMAVVDATCRLVPGVLKEDASYSVESFSQGLLEYPQYTRPPVFMGRPVPEILLSGHHENIEKWRRYQSLKRTYERRPDLLSKAELSQEDIKLLDKIKRECK
ncbi:MAG: tRNA (guanosine(37)-N1)-methyltransferase TrmD [Gracilibacteraceae bacterium]|nr:tRNA (guanosine(37)-N1)-methyltransferase TrmD [Gracilibacteraceae bacterium]